MILTLTITALTIISMVIAVLKKPYIKIKNTSVGLYWIICLVGAILLLLFKCVPLSFAINGITADTAVNPIKILVLFISMTMLSLYLGDAGFFDYVAQKIFEKNDKGGLKLFLILYFVVALLTVFTSNDIIILTFTPPICIFCKKAKVSPIPYLFGEFVSANTWSMTLIIGNPTNIYLAGSFGLTFFEYFKSMCVPSIVGSLTGLVILLLLFKKQLRLGGKEKNLTEDKDEKITVDKVPMIIALICLISCIISLSVSNFLGLEMWFICLIFALICIISTAVYKLFFGKGILRAFRVLLKAPYELMPFVLSMFIIVLSLENSGITEIISNALLSGKKADSIVFCYLSAISSNLLNNIPMSVLFERIINGKSLLALLSSVIGSNVGAFITPVGALAGIMWGKILSSYNVKFSFIKFTLYGLAVAVPVLLTSSLMLILIV